MFQTTNQNWLPESMHHVLGPPQTTRYLLRVSEEIGSMVDSGGYRGPLIRNVATLWLFTNWTPSSLTNQLLSASAFSFSVKLMIYPNSQVPPLGLRFNETHKNWTLRIKTITAEVLSQLAHLWEAASVPGIGGQPARRMQIIGQFCNELGPSESCPWVVSLKGDSSTS